MALGTFIAGPYTSVFDSSTLGMMQDGYEIRLRSEEELVNQSDIYGDSVIESIYRGGNCFLSMIGIEFGKLFNKSAPWIFGDENNSSLPALGFMGVVGRSAVGSGLVATTVLTAVQSGGSALASPASTTAGQAKLAEASDIQYQMTSKLRTLPLTFRLFPYTVTNPSGMPSGSYNLWFLNA